MEITVEIIKAQKDMLEAQKDMLEVLQKRINVYITAFLELLALDIPYKYKKEVFEIIKRANENTKGLQKKTEQILYQLVKNSQLNQNKEGKHE